MADDASIVVSAADGPPVAKLTVTPSSGIAPLEVSADASGSADTDATPIATYTFDFGDGTPPTGPQPDPIATHVYSADGRYTATVTVTDTAGLSDTATVSVLVGSNLIQNPGFEVDTSGWNSGTAPGVTLSRITGGHSGESAAMVANGGSTVAHCVLNDSPDWVRPTSAGVYTGSLWVRADTPGATLNLRFREWSSGVAVGSAATQLTLDSSWRLVSVVYTPAAAGTSTLDFNAYVANAPPGTCFYADDARIVRD
jgi:PKD repeat protein